LEQLHAGAGARKCAGPVEMSGIARALRLENRMAVRYPRAFRHAVKQGKAATVSLQHPAREVDKALMHKWHLLKPVALHMSIPTHIFTSLVARDFQPRIGLGSAFARPWLDASWSVADGRLSDEPEQRGRVGGQIYAMCGPLGPELHGMFEAHLPRVNAGLACGLCHQQTDQVVREQMNPQFFLDHLGREAAQDFHPE